MREKKQETDQRAPAARTARHTPGPWEVSPTGQYVRRAQGPAYSVCSMNTAVLDDWIANARLIAAAPALADALEALLDADPGSNDCNHPACTSARAALRAAGRLP